MEEKRRYFRERIFTFITLARNQKKIDAIAYDVSLGGISFVSSQVYEVGDTFTVAFNNNGVSIKRGGAIRWRNVVNKVVGMKRYGFEFDVLLLESEFEKICSLFIEE